MSHDPNTSAPWITLLGGGPVEAPLLERALSLAPRLIAADGGANHARRWGHRPERIIGDLDSINYKEFWEAANVPLIRVAEQDSTDFEKCLMAEKAGLYLGVGFLGGGLGHTLAAMRTLAHFKGERIVLLRRDEIVFRCPRDVSISLEANDPVSFFPMEPVSAIGTSKGLVWPLDGLSFSPAGQIGTSNMALGGPVEVAFDGDGMLMILPLERLGVVIAQLMA